MISGYFFVTDVVGRIAAMGAPRAVRYLAMVRRRTGRSHVPEHLRDDVLPAERHGVCPGTR